MTLAACGAPEPTSAPIAAVNTNTPVPPTDTPMPPTDTAVPPTDTPVPPTDTPVPPTPTPTPEPPTDTPTVAPTPAPRGWTQKADMPSPRWGFSTSVVNGKVYAIGGVGSSTKVEAYDPATDTWTQKAGMQRGRNLFGSAVVDGTIYVIGGNHSTTGGSLALVEAYDPATDAWTPKADMPTPRDSLSTCVVDGKIYAIGGFAYNPDIGVGKALATVEEYDPATDTWTTKAGMPSEKEYPPTSVVDGKIYVLGAGEVTTRQVRRCWSTILRPTPGHPEPACQRPGVGPPVRRRGDGSTSSGAGMIGMAHHFRPCSSMTRRPIPGPQKRTCPSKGG